jgi:hypothetical protein
MDNYDIRETDPQFLAKLMDLEAKDRTLWEPQELGEVLDHQLGSPLEFELPGVDARRVDALRAQCAGDRPLGTFRDLLHHPCPPIELFELTKEFAKVNRSDPDSPLAGEVASVLYILSIVAALVKCGRRITRLSDEALRLSLDWALGQSWLDKSTRALLEEGMDAVR